MLELLMAGGWVMLPLVLSSVLGLAICFERLYILNPKKIAPPHLLATVWKQLKKGELDAAKLKTLRQSSPLGRILAAGLSNMDHGRDVMKESTQIAYTFAKVFFTRRDGEIDDCIIGPLPGHVPSDSQANGRTCSPRS